MLGQVDETMPSEKVICKGRELGKGQNWGQTEKGLIQVNCGQTLRLSG